jgi:hypothetical protein
MVLPGAEHGQLTGKPSCVGLGRAARIMSEQNRKYVTKEIGKLLSEIWRIKCLAEPGVRPAAPHHQEARRHACGCPGAAARENREAVARDVPDLFAPDRHHFNLDLRILWQCSRLKS